ncbi:hypothetical protein BC941DRAFT_432049 [Chlamydoabsidia padenii]|nr:hypothetical protein BC941DRAFT_432049 [Chlamydoabsidia padenii]
MYRLGHNSKGWDRLMHHPFFLNTPWQDFNRKKGTIPYNINIQHYINMTTTTTTTNVNLVKKMDKVESDLLLLSTIVSSSPLPALSKESDHCASSSTTSSACKNNNAIQQQSNEGSGWLAAVYEYLMATTKEEEEEKDQQHTDVHYTRRLEELESAFTLFDWTMYDDYQGFMDRNTLTVGSPPSWVKPAFTDADNGRILPVPTLSTDRADDDELITPPTTPTAATFSCLDIVSPSYGVHDIYQVNNLVNKNPPSSTKKQRRSSTKYFNERREWERRKSLLITTPKVGI